MSETPANADVLRLTAQIVAAHVANNTVPPEALPALIQDIYRTLATVAAPPPEPVPTAAARPEPAVPVKKSVALEYIVCLEDGKKLKMLKRHLASDHGMTPEQYRARWNLPPDYPMVAPHYADQRSSLAKRIGLGTRPRSRSRA